MGDIHSKSLLYAKGAMFLGIGVLAAVLLLLQAPQWRVALLLGLAIWAFCRAYYFAFYVVEHYADPGYRFAGLGAFVWYLLRRRADGETPPQ